MKFTFSFALILFLFCSGSAEAQLQGTRTHALVQFKLLDQDSSVLAGEKVIFAGTNRRMDFDGITDEAGELEILLLEGDIYRIKLPNLISDNQHHQIKVEINEYAIQNFRVVIQYFPAQKITLDNIYFDTNKWDLKAGSFEELDQLSAYLKRRGNPRIEIAGHTDSRGNFQHNLTLSENRANAVADYLIKKGVDSNSISFKGYADKEPIADNQSPEGRAMNRRVEVRFLD